MPLTPQDAERMLSFYRDMAQKQPQMSQKVVGRIKTFKAMLKLLAVSPRPLCVLGWNGSTHVCWGLACVCVWENGLPRLLGAGSREASWHALGASYSRPRELAARRVTLAPRASPLVPADGEPAPPSQHHRVDLQAALRECLPDFKHSLLSCFFFFFCLLARLSRRHVLVSCVVAMRESAQFNV